MNLPGFDFSLQRQDMVRTQLRARDITDTAVLRALETVPRHEFVDPVDWDEAYEDHPLGIGCRQTISQPYIVAYLSQLLRVEPGMKILEIGTGSGYQSAVLAELGAEVFSVERHADLSEKAGKVLLKTGYADKVKLKVGDGTLGWPEEAPFDRIIVTAAGPKIPDSLVGQLAVGGRMALPVGGTSQHLRLIEKTADGVREKNDIAVVFVRLIGKEGFAAGE